MDISYKDFNIKVIDIKVSESSKRINLQKQINEYKKKKDNIALHFINKFTKGKNLGITD